MHLHLTQIARLHACLRSQVKSESGILWHLCHKILAAVAKRLYRYSASPLEQGSLVDLVDSLELQV